MTPSRMAATAAVAALFVPLACGAGGDQDGGDGDGSGATPVHVVASFYPLQFLVERVGGPRVRVDNLTPPGVEPHDLELTPDDAAGLHDADLVVFLAGFSAAVDDAIAAAASERALDVGELARLDLTYTPIEEGEQHDDERGVDPHFWLDPTRLADVTDELARRLGELDPDAAAQFTGNATTLRTELGELDRELAGGLADCASRDIVTSHNAFGYLADRYGLTQVGITGLTPEEEPSPRDLADVTEFVEEHDVQTIYYETLVSPDIAETVAAETGAATAVLDPLEGLSDASAGDDYFAVMRANLAVLREGQRCT